MSEIGDELYGLAGAYVLDALDDDERRRFEAALSSSPELTDEVASLREVAGLLGSAAVQTPPEGLKVAVMSRIDQVRQDRPVVSMDVARERRQGGARTSRAWVRHLSTGVAAAVVLVAVGLGVAVAQLSARVDQIQAGSEQVAAVVAAEDAQRVAADLPGGGHLSAVLSPQQGVALVVGEDLATLDEDEMYALWAIVDGDPVPVGELVGGRAFTVAGQPLESVGLTVEPRGALTQPTGEIIALLAA